MTSSKHNQLCVSSNYSSAAAAARALAVECMDFSKRVVCMPKPVPRLQGRCQQLLTLGNIRLVCPGVHAGSQAGVECPQGQSRWNETITRARPGVLNRAQRPRE